MSHIPKELIPLFESGIYLPMLLTVINQDVEYFESGNFKLKKPYLLLLNNIRTQIEKELQYSKDQFKLKKMKLKRGKVDKLFTEFYFYYEEIIELRRYSNIRLRNYTEHLLENYLLKHQIKYPTLDG